MPSRAREAQVVFGQMRTTVKLNRLKRTIRKAQSGASAPTKVSSELQDAGRQRQLRFSNEIDLRGMRADEAVQAVMYYIDDAIQYSAGRVCAYFMAPARALSDFISVDTSTP